MDKNTITLEDVKEQRILPISHIFYKENRELGKFEVYILNKDCEKLRTIEQFKNGDNSKDLKVVSCTEEMYGTICELEDNTVLDSVEYYNHWSLVDDDKLLKTFYLTEDYNLGDSKYTSLSNLEKWSSDRQKDLDERLEKEKRHKEEYEPKKKESLDLLDF